MKCKIQIFLWAILTFPCTIITLDDHPLLLDCGANLESTDSSGRKWIPDSRFLTTNNHSLSSTAKSQDPSLPSTVPYMQSRIFKSQSTYTLPISPTSRHWLRLHFYPTSYAAALDPAAALFSVSAAGLTLLHNFSAAITAQALTQAYIIREYSLTTLNSPLLHLTFTPDPDHDRPNAFAFINGIEIIPIPEIFPPEYYSRAMQTMFRLNVGGRFIAADEDSGLTRTWHDDSPHIYGAGFGVTTRAGAGVAYPSRESRLAAPPDVYLTARSMGPNSTLNLNYNLTWILDVDANFSYLVRLHFCDFFFGKVNQMVFLIFINNQTVETDADVAAWAGGKGVPVYKDYEVRQNGHNQLWLALHPNVESKPQYYDSILNGIEVFKLNDTKGNLAGPNPIPSLKKDMSQDATATKFPSRSRKKSRLIVILASLLASVAVLVGLIAACFKQSSKGGAPWLPIYGGSSSSSQISSRLGEGLCRHFSIGEIRAATHGFSEACVVGVGGFGKVYRGCIDGNATEVAVKRANPSSQQGLHEFLNEIELLSKLRHRHLVSLIGACEENNEMVLVYDYMANGTLREHLYNINLNGNKGWSDHLSWKQRLGICIGAARGIHYLHTGAKHPIIHRDVKTTNILLDDKWVAKVSDFGLSKARHALDQAHVSTAVKGSFGYLDPEYYRRQQLTDKSDVYSFGVVLFEVLCARPAIDAGRPREQLCLADWAVASYRKGAMEEMIDPSIRGEINAECLKRYTETAVKCLSEDSIDRPSMGEVLRNLEHCLKLQSGGEEEEQHSVNDAAFADVLETQGR
ncbi:receptor-like protein kinase FERONIA [Salvia miltiorrhiza]|uniref:receptor-like protein kinase FERONIA n=1 Tax=Salvia miltiorrhiza TaxID=226208 RepID=UPI0025ACF0EA|nr:receptor-like protein kinase FERONIA [Salvia miltiorrhiza]